MILPRKSQRAVWQSIEELPIWNFRKAQDGKLGYLYKEYSDKVTKTLQEHWQAIQDEFSEKVEMTEMQSHVYSQSKSLIMYKLDEIINERPANLSRIKTNIQMIERDLIKEVDRPRQDLFDQVAILKIHFKIDIDPRKMSVMEFYKYLKIYDEQSK